MGVFLGQGEKCTNGDFLTVQTTFSKRFDMSYYPFESHTLTVSLESAIPNNVATISHVGDLPSTSSASVPDGWIIDSSWSCATVFDNVTESARGGFEMSYDVVQCSISVSSLNTSWLLNDFFLFLLIILANCFTCLGWITWPTSSITGAPVEVLELPQVLNARVAITSTYCLAYIFAVDYKPYGQGLGSFSGSLPTSSLIYFCGLVALSSTCLWSAIAGFVATTVVRDRRLKWGVRSRIGDKPTCSTSGAMGVVPDEKDGKADEELKARVAKGTAFRAKLAVADFWLILVVHAASVSVAMASLINAATSYRT